MDIPEYTFKEVGYSGSLQDIANILEYPQEQVLFSGYIVIIYRLYFCYFQFKLNNIFKKLLLLPSINKIYCNSFGNILLWEISTASHC